MQEFQAVEAGERAPQRLRRKALDLADQAIATLDQIDSEGPKAVHDVRRRLKELRALADLLGARPDQDFFRGAGRRLASARDAKAALEVFDRLRERYADAWGTRKFMKIRRALAQRIPPNVDAQTVEQLRTAFIAERGQIAAWPVEDIRRDELWDAITRGYRRARRAMRTALDERTAELFHAWRKRTKDHWYHAQFFDEVGLARLEDYASALRKLSRKLGEHHDLVVLDQLCQRSPEMYGSTRYVRRFRGFVARRMKELESDTESMGSDFFDERARNWQVRVRLDAATPDVRLRVGPKKSPSRARRSSAISA